MGGSFSIEMKRLFPNSLILGNDISHINIKSAKRLELIDDVFEINNLSGFDIVLISVPVDISLKIVNRVLDHVAEHTLVLDVGSTKLPICNEVQNHPNRQNFLAMHPISGTENSGPDASVKGLYTGITNIVCEKEKTGLKQGDTKISSKAKKLPGSTEAQDLGSVTDSDIASIEQTQQTQSIESVGTVVTEEAQRTEKILPEGTPEKQYEFAVSFLKVGDYETAEFALKEFVDTNSKHELAGNAQYWYGETFRVRQLYQDAATAYLDGYQKYPKSSKAPVNLLKLGVMLVQIGEKTQGCSMILGVKDQYPDANQSIIQKAEYEKKKFNCKKKS